MSADSPKPQLPDSDHSVPNVIEVKPLISMSKGDLRRTSFIITATQQALSHFGISSKSIFSGGILHRTIIIACNYGSIC